MFQDIIRRAKKKRQESTNGNKIFENRGIGKGLKLKIAAKMETVWLVLDSLCLPGRLLSMTDCLSSV